jgi:hypothetical protein
MSDAAFETWVARARAVRIEHEVARRNIKLKRSGKEWIGPCPMCRDGDDRFAINVTKQICNCRVCGIRGDVIALVMGLDGVDFIAACTTLAGEPPPKANGKGRDGVTKIVVGEWIYQTEDGSAAFATERVQYQNADGSFVLKDGKPDKTFWQKRLDPSRPGSWLYDVEGVPIVPYRLPELIEAVSQGQTILIVEGEAKVDLLHSWKVTATCCAGGSGKWRDEHSKYLRGADVVILPDNDDAGRKHCDVVGAALQGIAKTVRVLELPDLPPKGDVIDWATAGHTVEQLHDVIEKAEPWTPPAADFNFPLRWHGDDDASATVRAWLVTGLLPETGCGLIAGQWGT